MVSLEGATGFFRLKRHQAFVGGYFGQAEVRLEGRPADGSRTAWRVDRQDSYCVQPGGQLQVYVDAAIEGAGDGLELVSRCGVDTDPYCVGIVHVLDYVVDIEVTSVRAATAVAVADAFGVIDRMGLSFHEHGEGSSGPGSEPRRVVWRWTAHVVEGIENLEPLAAAVVRSPGVRTLPYELNRARENETWIVDDVAVTPDVDTGVLSFASVSDPSMTETAPLASVMEIMTARSRVEAGRPPARRTL